MNPILINEASFTGIVRLLGILILIYAIYSLIVRYLLPIMVNKSVRKFQEKCFEDNPHLRKNREKQQEGEITITRSDDVQAKQEYNNAEDTDYEEIK
ncbi:MAG TPA: hypothetical protein PLP88_10840 [Bacteroidales bacterium]|nr:hypothetical protein [Bacteroidales bacterium]